MIEERKAARRMRKEPSVQDVVNRARLISKARCGRKMAATQADVDEACRQLGVSDDPA